jgi:hypothetical protein
VWGLHPDVDILEGDLGGCDSPKGMGQISSEQNPCWILDIRWKEGKILRATRD